MRTTRILFFIPVLLLLLNFSTPPAELNSAERKAAIEYMKKTNDDLMKSIKGLSPEQLNFKSAPDSWSVAECVEHIAMSETNLFNWAQGTLKEPANPAKRSEIKITDEKVYATIADRSWKVKTQETLVPTGKFGTYEGSVKEFKDKRAATIKYLETTKDDLRNHVLVFPAEAFGTMDSYQLLIFMAGHTKRHTSQIDEIKSNPGFPKK